MKKVRKKAFWGALASVIGGAMQIGANAMASKANREAENERFERELKAREDLIEKNRFYNLMQNEITQQMNSNQNQSIYDSFRNAKCGTRIKVKRKKGEYGMLSTPSLFNPYKLGNEKINLNLPTINNTTTNDINVGSNDVFGKVFGVISNGMRGRELTEKSVHNNILNRLNNKYPNDNFVNRNNLKLLLGTI